MLRNYSTKAMAFVLATGLAASFALCSYAAYAPTGMSHMDHASAATSGHVDHAQLLASAVVPSAVFSALFALIFIALFDLGSGFFISLARVHSLVIDRAPPVQTFRQRRLFTPRGPPAF